MAAAAHRATVNQQNAQHSTGPRTPEGKDRARLNALRHGAYSTAVVLEHEDPAAYHALGDRLAKAFQPYDHEQRDVLRSIQDTQWRLDRVLSLEANLYAIGVRDNLERARSYFPGETEASVIALARAYAYIDQARTFDQLHRQETRLRRLLDRTYVAYLDLVFHADGFHLPTPEAHPAPEPDPAPAGFVSHNPPAPPQFTGPLADIKRKQWLRKQTKERSASAPAS